jgi:hypothetical protein
MYYGKNGVDQQLTLRIIFEENPPFQNISIYSGQLHSDGSLEDGDPWYSDDPSASSAVECQSTNTSTVSSNEDVSRGLTISGFFSDSIGEIVLDLSLLYISDDEIIDMDFCNIIMRTGDPRKVERVKRMFESLAKLAEASVRFEFPLCLIDYPGWRD